MAPLIIGRPEQKGSTGRDNRIFVKGGLWIVRRSDQRCSGAHFRGDVGGLDFEYQYLIVDSTIVGAHQHAAGAKKGV